MTAARYALALALLLVAAGAHAEPPVAPRRASPTPAPLEAASCAVAADEGEAMLDRLRGHQARLIAGRLVIDDIAGDGRPWVGTVERRGDRLWLRTDGGARLLAGALARPRIAGPGYRVWVVGARIADAAGGDEGALLVRRLGVLARP